MTVAWVEIVILVLESRSLPRLPSTSLSGQVRPRSSGTRWWRSGIGGAVLVSLLQWVDWYRACSSVTMMWAIANCAERRSGQFGKDLRQRTYGPPVSIDWHMMWEQRRLMYHLWERLLPVPSIFSQGQAGQPESCPWISTSMPAQLHQLRVLGDPEASCLAVVLEQHKLPGRTIFTTIPKYGQIKTIQQFDIIP